MGRGKEYQEEDSVSTSCISSEPTMQAEVSSSTLAPLGDEKFHLDEKEAHERSLKASVVKTSAMLLFMISSFIAIFAAGSFEFPLHFASLVDLKKGVRIPGFVYIVLKELRTRVRVPGFVYIDLEELRTRIRVPGSVYIVLEELRTRVRVPGAVYAVFQSKGNAHFAIGCALAAVLVIGVVIYSSSRKKQSKGVFTSIEDIAIEEAPAEIECENDGVLKPSVSTSSNPPEASPQLWKPISLLNVKLELEYSAGEMSSVEKLSPSDETQVFVRNTRRKSMSTITHNLVKRDSSVGSSSSCDRARSRECKAEMPLRRSSRLRNKVMSPPSTGALQQITSRG